MTNRAISRPQSPPFPQLVGPSAGLLVCVGAAGISAALVLLMGFWALLVPLYAALIGGALFAPRKFVFVFLAMTVAIEPQAIDFTGPLSDALYSMPPALKDAFPMTISPMELLLVLAALSLWCRPSLRERKMPRLLWLVPLIVAFGFIYGTSNGGKTNLGYNEARGLLYGCAAFAIAARMGIDHPRPIRIAILAGGLLLSVIVIARYIVFFRGGNAALSIEASFAHEDSALLGIAFMTSSALLVRTKSMSPRLWLILNNLIILAAIMASARRSGFLVLFVGGLVMAWLLLPKRPHLVLTVMVPVVILGSAYMAAYWNKDYGAMAEPARAIRSQIDPSARDESSDQYRVVEKFDVEQTLWANRLFGVGFGRPFTQYLGLPNLTSFWSLQFYTPHTNILWLWLKMGAFGITILLSIWVLALKRCLVAFRDRPRSDPVPVLPLILACTLVMYLAYARVDLALISTRSMAPFAASIALALCLPPSHGKREANP